MDREQALLTSYKVWSQWRKHLAMVSTCSFVFMSQFGNGSITPLIVPIIIDFNISVEQATRLITLNILFTGIGVGLNISLSI